MALNRFEVGIVARAKGQSAIARAAYNARDKLVNERTNEQKDYRYLGEAEFQGIFAPPNAPSWATDRQQLWNEVERREDKSTRRDHAQFARDFKIALPHELNAEQRLWLVKDFAREMARKGMVVDVAIHTPDRHNDERNYHVHMLCTTRVIGPDGLGNKNRDWNRTEELLKWRERWSELGSRALDRAGFTLEAQRFGVGHLTLDKQREAALRRGDHGWANTLDREPTKHLGPHAAALEHRGVETRKGDINREISDRNWTRENVRALQDSLANGQVMRDQLPHTPRNIRLAFDNSIDPRDFKKDLEHRGLHLARITEDDHRNSHTFRFVANRHGKDSPILYFGEYVVVDQRGHAYRLSYKTTGMESLRVKEFMKGLDKDPAIPPLHQVRSELERERESPDPRPTGLLGRRTGGKEPRLSRLLNRTAERIAGKALEFAANAIESLVAPLSPRQKLDGEIASWERQETAERTERERRNINREYDRDR